MVEGGHFANVKPIFHCDAKLFALGTGVGLDPQRHIFALPIPTCWYLKTLKFCITPNANFKIHPMQNPNASQWIQVVLGSKRKILALAMYISCFLC